MKILLTLCFIALGGLIDGETTEKIVWQEHRKLTWNDFKGTPEHLGEYVASTNSGMSFSYSFKTKGDRTEVTYTVASNFYPDLSWFLPNRVTDYILKHEQTHFDISELHARKLRKKLAALPDQTDTKLAIEQAYREIEKERRKMQADFDRETEHSKHSKNEERWELFIAQQLETFSQWK